MPEQAELHQDILDLQQAAELLKTSKPTLYRWLAQGKLQGFKAGGQWRFYRRDLIKFLEYEEPLTARVDVKEVNRLIAILEERLHPSAKRAEQEKEAAHESRPQRGRRAGSRSTGGQRDRR